MSTSPPAPAATASPVRPSARSVLGAVVSPRTWLATAHVLLDLLIGTISFSVVFSLLATSAGLAITFVLAIPVLWLTLWCARLTGRFERARASALLGVEIPNPERTTTGTFWTRVRQRCTDPADWRAVAYCCLLLPIGAVGFSLVVAAWAGSLAMVALPFYVRALPGDTARFGLFDLSANATWAAAAVGLVGLVLVAPWVARGWAAIDVALARSLLGRSATDALTERVDTLETTRARAVDAAEAERRRIERDLHDGAQQRLVALAMDLGMAKAKLDDDPAAARALIDEAHGEAKRAIAELRDLARGIHPVALTDRGLPEAVAGLADRSPVPVHVTASVPERPSPTIEGIAYFVVSECLANIAKHSGATHGAVEVVRSGDQLTVTVSDDGHGGADPARGSGLRGLLDRVAAVDGTLHVHSPIGGPTAITAELPCRPPAGPLPIRGGA